MSIEFGGITSLSREGEKPCLPLLAGLKNTLRGDRSGLSLS